MMNQRLVCFDMDGTLITNNKWLDFNKFLGITKVEDEAIFRRYSTADINYKTVN